jgi:hypothetical protein
MLKNFISDLLKNRKFEKKIVDAEMSLTNRAASAKIGRVGSPVNHALLTFVNVDIFDPPLIISLLLLLPFLFILNLITAIIFLNLLAYLLNCLQLILNSTAHAITRTPKFSRITPIHWQASVQNTVIDVVAVDRTW